MVLLEVLFDAKSGTGRATTLKVLLIIQLLIFLYVMEVVPAATAVTTPVLLTIAADILDEVHVPELAGVPFPLRVVLLPAHKLNSPVIVGNAFTVTDDGAETQPLLSL